MLEIGVQVAVLGRIPATPIPTIKPRPARLARVANSLAGDHWIASGSTSTLMPSATVCVIAET